jgi:type IV secretory pathway VirB6-like protein
MKYLALLLVFALTTPAFATHGRLAKNRAARLNAAAAKANLKAAQLNAANYNADLRAALKAEQLRQQLNGNCHHNNGALNFRQQFNGGCSDLY